MSFSIVAIGPASAAGSPGPFERKIPSGSDARIASAEAVAGKTVTRQPAALSSRTMLRFMP